MAGLEREGDPDAVVPFLTALGSQVFERLGESHAVGDGQAGKQELVFEFESGAGAAIDRKPALGHHDGRSGAPAHEEAFGSAPDRADVEEAGQGGGAEFDKAEQARVEVVGQGDAVFECGEEHAVA